MGPLLANKYRFEYKELPNRKEEETLSEKIDNDVFLKMKMDKSRSFGIFVKNESQVILAGVVGSSFYGCLSIEMLWVDRSLRSQGFGTKLMQEAEQIARERHCHFVTLNTMDFQALPFYQKIGYEIEFIRDGYNKSSKMYMLRKPLNPF